LKIALMMLNCVWSGAQPKLYDTLHKSPSFTSVPEHNHPSNGTNIHLTISTPKLA